MDLEIVWHERVAELRLQRVAARNALSTSFAVEITEATASLATEPSVRAVVLTSADPKAFCVGADLKERASFTDADILAQRPYFQAAFAGVRELPVPTIAAVQGYALGGGYEFALSCDLIVADETAVVGLTEVSVGVVPGGGGTQLLARRVGPARAADLIFTARRVGADEAARLGLVDRLVPAGQAQVAAFELAQQIAANSPVGVRQAKHALRAGTDSSLAEGLELEDAAWRATVTSLDRHEGIRAFIEKRPPQWP